MVFCDDGKFLDALLGNLFENIFLEYARLMQRYGINKAVGYYCSKAGGRGRKLLEELSSGNEPLAAERDDMITSTDHGNTESDYGSARKTDRSIFESIEDTDKSEGSAKEDTVGVQKGNEAFERDNPEVDVGKSNDGQESHENET